ncbi:MAG: hypothetical protein H7Y04_08350 [Verrucomicrobia bacterium]|nr:hypothetical protein [Cytophagales bacterium]
MQKVLIFLSLMVLLANCQEKPLHQITVKRGNFFYTDGIASTQAHNTVSFLAYKGYFDKGETIQLEKSEASLHLKMVSKNPNDTTADLSLKLLGKALTEEVFSSQKLLVELCDEQMQVKRTLQTDNLKIKSLPKLE